MTAFSVVMLWLAGCWLLTLRSQPLQSDQLEDDLGDVDLADRAYRRLLREADFLASPKINVRLSGRWVKR